MRALFTFVGPGILVLNIINQLFNKRGKRPKVGLINCMNNRGLGTESRLLQMFFSAHMKDFEFSIYKIPAGRKGKDFDNTWESNPGFIRWLDRQSVVMSIEHFMPNIYAQCRKKGIKTIWRPNFEWISPDYGYDDFCIVDAIMTPQIACANFLEDKFKLNNVVRNPWITELPIIKKNPSEGKTKFLFNAGRGGIGDRRNHHVVIDAFAELLEKRDDIELTIKTQVPLNVAKLEKFKAKNFHYIERNTGYKANLRYYTKADFSLAPSKWEGLGFALLESLYCGTPVITVDAPPMNEWVQHKKTGYIVPCHFPDLPLPIEYNRDNQLGLNWVRAALCEPGDIVKAVEWLADNKTSMYRDFNEENQKVLEQRKRDFIHTFTSTLNSLQ